MSHFSVLVIGENVEEQLAPYDENITAEPYVKYTFESAKIERQKNIAEYNDILSLPEDKRKQYNIPYIEERLAKLQSTSDEEYYNSIKEGYDQHNEAGEPLSTYNPKSKWDWWSVGGRWADFFLSKDGVFVDSIRKGDLDFEGMIKSGREECGNTYDKAQVEIASGKTPLDIVKFIYGINPGESKEEYITRKYPDNTNPYRTFAIVKDGEWIEKGEMGWWAVVSDEKEDWPKIFDKIWDDLPDDTILTIVDCHI